MKSKIKLKHTSFLILVKDEDFFSKKLVNHINSQNEKAEFIIADGRKKKKKKIFNKINKKKEYYYFGEDKNYQIFFLKTLKGIKKCSKRFIFFCDQDHLINFKIIKKDEEFLLKNKDYSAVGGPTHFFTYIKNKIKVTKHEYGIYYFDFNSFFLKYCFNMVFRSHHYLQRKKNLKKVWNLIIEHKIKDARSDMFVQDLLTLIFGKIKYHNNTSVITWAGMKKRDTKKNKGHFLNKSHNTRYEWFKYFFTEHKNLIKKIIKENKIFFNNLYVFKAYYFIFNILKNIIKRIIGYRQLITFIRRFANRFINNDQIKIFKQLKLDEIIKPEDLLRKKM